MEHRYCLRFESGERAGETIPIQGQGFTIGRRPGNALQILDNSVSGHHAEIVIDGEGARVEDLGSTNGTKVRGERVKENRLVPGDRVHFGAVEMVFLDAAASPTPAGGAPVPAAAAVPAPIAIPATAAVPAAAAAPAPAAAPEEGMLRVDAALLKRAKKRPLAGLGVLVLLVAVAVGLWFRLRKVEHAAERPVKAVAASADNLLGDDASFESDSDGWTAADAPAAFVKSAEGRVSGATGIVGDLTDGAWAVHRSREVRAEAGRALAASAEIRADEGAVGQVGIELSPAAGADAAGTVVAWSKPAEASGKFAPCSVAAPVPPGYESARVLLLGRRGGSKGGSVAADDASLAVSAAPAEGAPATLADWQLLVLGDASAAVLSKSGRPLVTSLAFAAGPDAAQLAQAGHATANAEAGRIALASTRKDGLTLRAEAALVRAGIATTGAEGFATHGPDFERGRATSLLLGKGNEAVRVVFGAPVSLKGVAEGSASRIQATPEGGDVGDVSIQLDFAEDRKKAGDLAYAARNAEKKGDLGECLAKWSELLNDVPFDDALVAEGDQKRASLVQQGLFELQAVRLEVDRAKFFRLVDLDRRCKSRALAVGSKYKGSEVDAEAQRIVAGIDEDLLVLEADLARVERSRLEGILAALEATKSTGLAAEVRAHLETMPKRPGAAAPQGSDAEPAAPGKKPEASEKKPDAPERKGGG